MGPLGSVSGETEKGPERGPAVRALEDIIGFPLPDLKRADTLKSHFRAHFHPLWKSQKEEEGAARTFWL